MESPHKPQKPTCVCGVCVCVCVCDTKTPAPPLQPPLPALLGRLELLGKRDTNTQVTCDSGQQCAMCSVYSVWGYMQ